jgi:hypothetical protein
MRRAGHVARIGKRRGVYRAFVGKIWEDNIKMAFKKRDGGIGWIDVVQDRYGMRALVNAVMNLRAP